MFGFKFITSPTFNPSNFDFDFSWEEDEETPTYDISKELSLFHTQLLDERIEFKIFELIEEDEGEDGENCKESEDEEVELKLAIVNNFEQSVSYFKYCPPWFVGESKEITILLPSDENIAPIIKGPGNASLIPFTTNSSPDGNEIL